MEHTSITSKLQKSVKTKKQLTHTQHIQLNEKLSFKLCENQVQTIRERLPTLYFLVNTTNDELQLLQNDCKVKFNEKIYKNSKNNEIKSKKQGKKITASSNIKNLTNSYKIEQKDGLSEMPTQKGKKHKKNLKKSQKDKLKQKQANELFQSQNKSLLQQNFNDSKLELVYENQQTKKIKQNNSIKQINYKENEPQLIQNQQAQIKQPIQQPINPNNYLEKQQKFDNFYQYNYPIPYLQSGLLRYKNQLFQTKPHNRNAQTENLHYRFGLSSISVAQQPKLDEKQKIFCINIIHKLKAHRSSQAFRIPVNPERQGVPDYHYVIYKPIDLQTIGRKVIKDKYRQISQFHADINLIFLNSYKYNMRWSKYFVDTVELQDYYHQLLQQAIHNPEQFAIQQPIKGKSHKEDSDQGEYIGQTILKKNNSKKKNQMLTKSHKVNQEQKVKYIRKKNSLDDYSGVNSYSMNIQSNYFHVEAENIKKQHKYQQNEQINIKQKFKINQNVNSYKQLPKDVKQMQIKIQKPQVQPDIHNFQTNQPFIQPFYPQNQFFVPTHKPSEYSISKKKPNTNYLNSKKKQPQNLNNFMPNQNYNNQWPSHYRPAFQQEKDKIQLQKNYPMTSIPIKSSEDYMHMMTMQNQTYNHSMAQNKYPQQQAHRFWRNFNEEAYNIQMKKQMQIEKYYKQNQQQIYSYSLKQQKQLYNVPPPSQQRHISNPQKIYQQQQNHTQLKQHNMPLKQPQATLAINQINYSQTYSIPNPNQPHVDSLNIQNNPTTLQTNIDADIQHTEHPNSGMTATLTNKSTYPQKQFKQYRTKQIAKAPKQKQKNKNKDEQYRYQSQDQQYVTKNQRNYSRRQKLHKIQKQNQQPSNTTQNKVHKKRGRHPKKPQLQNTTTINNNQQPSQNIVQTILQQNIQQLQLPILQNQSKSNIPSQIKDIKYEDGSGDLKNQFAPQNIFMECQNNNQPLDGFLEIQFSQNNNKDYIN